MTSILSRESISSASFPLPARITLNQTLKASRVKFNNSILSSTNKTVNFLLPNSETEVTSSPTPTTSVSVNPSDASSVSTTPNGKDNTNEAPSSELSSRNKFP